MPSVSTGRNSRAFSSTLDSMRSSGTASVGTMSLKSLRIHELHLRDFVNMNRWCSTGIWQLVDPIVVFARSQRLCFFLHNGAQVVFFEVRAGYTSSLVSIVTQRSEQSSQPSFPFAKAIHPCEEHNEALIHVRLQSTATATAPRSHLLVDTCRNNRFPRITRRMSLIQEVDST